MKWFGGLIGQVSVSPDAKAIPGGPQLQRLINGITWFGLLILVGAGVVGAVWWAAGQAQGNPHAVSAGKRMVMVSMFGAMVTGAAAALVNFFHGLGTQVGG